MEILKRFDPQLRRVLVLNDHHDHSSPELARRAAEALGVKTVERYTTSATEVERAFAELKVGEVGGVIVASNDLRTNFMTPVLAAAERAGVPVAAHRKAWVEGGALFSYSTDYAAAGPVAARYVDEIFKGAKPSDLPAEEMSKISLIINLTAAKRFGLGVDAGGGPRGVFTRCKVITLSFYGTG